MVFNATFNNISVTSWLSVLLVEEDPPYVLMTVIDHDDLMFVNKRLLLRRETCIFYFFFFASLFHKYILKVTALPNELIKPYISSLTQFR
jgi:hypothetical protein